MTLEDKIKELENNLDQYYGKVIIEIYEELLHRSPSKNELKGWKSQLKAHNSTPQHCRNLLRQSKEYHKVSEKPKGIIKYLAQLKMINQLNDETKIKIDDLYRKILQRPADKDAIEHYGRLLKLGELDEKGLEQKLLDSSEYSEFKRIKLQQKFQTSYSSTELKKIIDSVPEWYHTFKFDNIVTQNSRTDDIYQNWISQAIPLNLENKKILDIGKADGYYSFLCESRGAKKIVATDFSPDYAPNLFPGFNAAKKILNSKVEFRDLFVEQLEQIDEKFDIVLFLGIYYHLSNPILALEKIYNFVTDSVIFSGPILNSDEPIMAYYDPFELHPNDDSNWWVASPSCILQSAKRIGFKKTTMISSKDIWEKEDDNPFLSNKIKNTVRNVSKHGLFKFSK